MAAAIRTAASELESSVPLWTPEPWPESGYVYMPGSLRRAPAVALADYLRARECVHAMSGTPRPAAAVEALRAGRATVCLERAAALRDETRRIMWFDQQRRELRMPPSTDEYKRMLAHVQRMQDLLDTIEKAG